MINVGTESICPIHVIIFKFIRRRTSILIILKFIKRKPNDNQSLRKSLNHKLINIPPQKHLKTKKKKSKSI